MPASNKLGKVPKPKASMSKAPRLADPAVKAVVSAL
jgi:hypothetical protein